ncbi:MAG TPA: MBL fold metallo-hydrolase [Methanocella sp.]|uniref:MBL fold metallo-hydrolase n=1 Tax=Methanocella sp. TaxID=2052833 RepID=UPI002C4D8B22|nr:MBL fold metallo-hydrolase [Methanocella sp.]HTY89912.1 MBL fold metallo-hydrolase [Methanocella sp.]
MRVKNVNGISYDSNAYLIDAKRKTLVDAGMDPGRVLQNLDGGLDLILLTHCHFDHIGAVPGIVKATGAKVAIHEEDAALLHNDNAAAMFNARRPEFGVDIVLSDGEDVDLGDVILKVIHTPGHTPGSICLYDKESKVLFTGDTVFEGGSFGRTDIGGDPEAMIRSLETLTKLDVSALYPGHGGAVLRKAKESILASYNNAKQMLF